MTIIPVFQPIYDAKSNTFPCCETLARWLNERGEVIGPSNVSSSIDWAKVDIEIATQILAVKSRLNKYFKRIFLNVSQETLSDEYSFDIWRNKVSRIANSISGDLTIEITEGISPEMLEKRWCKIAECGVTFAIDDYGSHYSDLLRLKSYPWLFCKIDVNSLTSFDKYNDEKLFAKGGMQIIAERVETFEQCSIAQMKSVYLQQGFKHYHPSRLEDIEILKERYESN